MHVWRCSEAFMLQACQILKHKHSMVAARKFQASQFFMDIFHLGNCKKCCMMGKIAANQIAVGGAHGPFYQLSPGSWSRVTLQAQYFSPCRNSELAVLMCLCDLLGRMFLHALRWCGVEPCTQMNGEGLVWPNKPF